MNSRRIFFTTIITGGIGLTTKVVSAQAKLNDKDPQAVALGYVADSTKVDKKKYPNHTDEQRCSGCQLFSGKAADATAACAVFSGKQVAGIGWCSVHAKK
jgi:hypothetical protein